MDLLKLVDNLFAIPGVLGLCLIDSKGALRLNRMPAHLDNQVLETLPPYLVALHEQAVDCLPETNDLVLRFREHWLMLRHGAHATLILFGSHSASLTSVRMVSNLVLRQLDDTGLTALPNVPESVATIAPAKPVIAPTQRMYRGNPY